MDRSEILKYFVHEYFANDLKKAAKATEFTVQQLQSWMNGDTRPQKATIEYLIHCVLAPEFKVVVEFGPFNFTEKVRPQLRKILKGHENKSGIYAFYDSMASLLYVGKATSLLKEIEQSLGQDVTVMFPKGVKLKPQKRAEVTRYISAYDVGSSDFQDYPKHVESLILRISKPPLNKRIGNLSKLPT